MLRKLLEKTGTVEQLAGIAGILAHEMQNVRHRHATNVLVKQLSLHVLAAALLGDSQLGGATETLARMRYGRGLEAEADRDGLSLMQASGLDGNEMVDAFQMLEKEAPDIPHVLR